MRTTPLKCIALAVMMALIAGSIQAQNLADASNQASMVASKQRIEKKDAVELNVASFNIRLNNSDDKENAWPNRKDWVNELIQYHSFDIFGVQEAKHDQMLDLKRLPGFDYVGVGRDDGKEKGEYAAIFYDNRKFKVLKSDTFWLSLSPEKPSLGWDAQIVRVCTWAEFQDLATGKQFYFFNTHFDHIGEKAREESSKLILAKVKELAKGDKPVIVTGDFNVTPDATAYKNMAKELGDAREVSIARPYGPVGTFQSFDYNSPLKDRIDFIFVNKLVKVLKYAALTDVQNQRYPSDHLPIVSRVEF